MVLEQIIYQSLLYFSVLLGGILGISYIIHLLRKGQKVSPNIDIPIHGKEISNKLIDVKTLLEEQRRNRIITEAKRTRAEAIIRDKRREYERARVSRYIVVNNEIAIQKKNFKREMSSTIIENPHLDFYQ